MMRRWPWKLESKISVVFSDVRVHDLRDTVGPWGLWLGRPMTFVYFVGYRPI